MENVTIKANVIERATAKAIDNNESKNAKESVKKFFDTFETQLKIQWDGLKNEDTAFKALNNVIAGIAGGKGEKPYIWLIKNFSRYATENGIPCNKRKDENGRIYYKTAMLTGVTARGILKKAALNCIESQRLGNRFEQKVVTPEK